MHLLNVCTSRCTHETCIRTRKNGCIRMNHNHKSLKTDEWIHLQRCWVVYSNDSFVYSFIIFLVSLEWFLIIVVYANAFSCIMTQESWECILLHPRDVYSLIIVVYEFALTRKMHLSRLYASVVARTGEASLNRPRSFLGAGFRSCVPPFVWFVPLVPN